MNIRKDITSPRLLHLKGGLFLFLGIISAAVLLLENFNFRSALLLGITIWSFCRFYYFLFYVLEHYAGREQKYAGLWDALMYFFKRKQPQEPKE